MVAASVLLPLTGEQQRLAGLDLLRGVAVPRILATTIGGLAGRSPPP